MSNLVQNLTAKPKRGTLVQGLDDELNRRVAELSEQAGRQVNAEAIYSSREFRLLDAELALRGLPRWENLDVETLTRDKPQYALQLERRLWLCTTKAGLQCRLIGEWRAVVGPCDLLGGEICVPERVVIYGGAGMGGVTCNMACVTREALEGLAEFATELAELGADVTDALGVSLHEIKRALAAMPDTGNLYAV